MRATDLAPRPPQGMAARPSRAGVMTHRRKVRGQQHAVQLQGLCTSHVARNLPRLASAPWADAGQEQLVTGVTPEFRFGSMAKAVDTAVTTS